MKLIAKSTLIGLALSGLLANAALADDKTDAQAKAAEQAKQAADKAAELKKEKEAEYEKEHGGKPMPDVFAISYEKPGVDNTTTGVKFLNFGVETFANLKPGVQSFDTNYGTGGAIVGGYTDLGIKYASSVPGTGDSKLTEQELVELQKQLKEKGETSKTPLTYAYAPPGSTIDLQLSAKNGLGIDYLGFYLPTTDQNGTVTFYRDGVEVGSLSQEAFQKGFEGESDDQKGQGVFVNIFDKNGAFDEVKFTSGEEGSGFFSGDHTVGQFDNGGGGGAGAVPEPATWTMMILGVGLIGGALRRRRGAMSAAAAA